MQTVSSLPLDKANCIDVYTSKYNYFKSQMLSQPLLVLSR